MMSRRRKQSKKGYRCTTANYEVSEGFMASRKKRMMVIDDNEDSLFPTRPS